MAWIARVTGKPYRLLSEAEWEYVARAGGPKRFSFGDDEAILGKYAWYHDNSEARLHPVGQKSPNAFGLYDTHGNVWEFVEDCYKDNYDGAPTDGAAWITINCDKRVDRGGSYLNAANGLRSAQRFGITPDSRFIDTGFRVGRTLTP